MNIGETLVMINQNHGKPIQTGGLARRLMPTIKSEYERFWDELGGPANIGVSPGLTRRARTRVGA
jgi:hypothetical protein